MFSFKSNKLPLNTLLGKGSNSTVYPYQRTPQDARWAVKIIHADTFEKLLSVQQNIAVVFSMDHPRILPIIGFHAEKQRYDGYNICIKLPRMQSDLAHATEDHIRQRTRFREESLLLYLRDILSGLSMLNSRNRAHGNIKPSNLLLDEQGRVQLADMDVTSYKPNFQQTGYIEDRDFYLSSEQLQITHDDRKKYKGLNDDLWSLGVVFLELCLLEPKLISPVLNYEERRSLVERCLFRAKAKYSSELTQILSSLLVFDPARRGSASECLQKVTQILREICLRSKQLAQSQSKTTEEFPSYFDRYSLRKKILMINSIEIISYSVEM